MTRSRSGRRRNAVALGATSALLPVAGLAAHAPVARRSDDSGPAVHRGVGAGWKDLSSAITAGRSSTLMVIGKGDCTAGLTCTRYDDATTA
ncbi:hypothetical protein ACWCPS_25725 [Streptomyces mauvecolor]